MALTSRLSVQLSLSTKTSADLGSNSGTRALAVARSLADGVDAGEADRAFVDTRQLAASATEDLDVAGSLVGIDGTAAVFARVKFLVVTADAANTNSVQVTRPASNGLPIFMAAGDGVAVRPGGVLVIGVGEGDATGYAVTAGTGDLVTFTNSAGGSVVNYSVAIVGCST